MAGLSRKRKKKKSQGVLIGKRQFEETAIIQAKHAGMLELSGQKFKTTIMNILRVLVRKCRQYGQEQKGKH